MFDLGTALKKAGKLAESKAVLADFERKALKESEGWDNANRELISYYADYAAQPAAALRIALQEIARRRDVMTLDAYAWALYRNGRSKEALAEIESALVVGTVDPRILYHAGAIAMAAGALLGGYLASLIALRLPDHVVRRAIVVIGLSSGVWLLRL